MADEGDEFTLGDTRKGTSCLETLEREKFHLGTFQIEIVCFDEGFMSPSTHFLLICNFLLLVQVF